jgi:hypothetical protein
MDRYSRVIFAFLLLITSVSGLIESWTQSKVVPLTGPRVQARTSRVGSATIPTREVNSSYVDEGLLVDRSVRASGEKFPCELLEITAFGVVCDDHRLDLPKIDLKEILDEDRHLPRRSITVFVSEKFVDGILYRNIALELRWEPATPEFLQIYLEEYLPYWGNRIPYRLFWDARYEVCIETCSTFSDAGEFLPEDIENLSPSLAADVNFNGVPAAFWNVNINP